jgi:hypothetical protein
MLYLPTGELWLWLISKTPALHVKYHDSRPITSSGLCEVLFSYRNRMAKMTIFKQMQISVLYKEFRDVLVARQRGCCTVTGSVCPAQGKCSGCHSAHDAWNNKNSSLKNICSL